MNDDLIREARERLAATGGMGPDGRAERQYHTRVITELEAAEARVLRVVRGEFTQICSYCGWEGAADGEQWEGLQAHVAICPAHPMRQVEARVRELETALPTTAAHHEKLGYNDGRKDGHAEGVAEGVAIASARLDYLGATYEHEESTPSNPQLDVDASEGLLALPQWEAAAERRIAARMVGALNLQRMIDEALRNAWLGAGGHWTTEEISNALRAALQRAIEEA
jgi:hypothetical protein